MTSMFRGNWFTGLAVAAGLSLFGSVAVAAPTIIVGDRELLPNTSGQVIQIFVTGGDQVQGLNFNAQIADGGPELDGSIDGPTITDADIITGTIFAASNTGEQDPGSFPQLALRTTTTNASVSPTVPATGLLATLTIDTTGFESGTFALRLGDTLNGPTDFSGVEANITDGSITIVPEPAALSLLAGAGLLVLRRRRA